MFKDMKKDNGKAMKYEKLKSKLFLKPCITIFQQMSHQFSVGHMDSLSARITTVDE